MRLWSVHPKYLDRQGLLAVWREGLLAEKVLEGKTRGYKNHPQLLRFKQSKKPLSAIQIYLHQIYLEAKNRNYRFAESKLKTVREKIQIPLTHGQLEYETEHLKQKLKIRSLQKFKEFKTITKIIPHPIFKLKKGPKEIWEKTLQKLI